MTPTPELVTSADMVFVTLNYRLGPLGFMALNVKDAESQQPIRGNFGLMDQYLGMEWVKNNSRAFGADPDKVRTTPRDVISYHELLCSYAMGCMYSYMCLLVPSQFVSYLVHVDMLSSGSYANSIPAVLRFFYKLMSS